MYAIYLYMMAIGVRKTHWLCITPWSYVWCESRRWTWWLGVCVLMCLCIWINDGWPNVRLNYHNMWQRAHLCVYIFFVSILICIGRQHNRLSLDISIIHVILLVDGCCRHVVGGVGNNNNFKFFQLVWISLLSNSSTITPKLFVACK